MAHGPENRGSDFFLTVLRGLLRPLMRMLIARGIGLPILYRLIKQAYVETAEREITLAGERPTDSRISVLTGVHRRDVRDIRNAGTDQWDIQRRDGSVLASVIGRWLADPDLVQADGTPSALSRPRFETLVAGLNKDVRPRTVLDALIQQGLIRVTDHELLELTQAAVAGPQDNLQKMTFFAENIGDHLAAASANLTQDPAPHFERAVFYNGLSSASVAEIEALARKLGEEALLDVNAAAQSRQQNDQQGAGGTARFRFGLYFYREDQAKGAGEDNPPATEPTTRREDPR